MTRTLLHSADSSARWRQILGGRTRDSSSSTHLNSKSMLAVELSDEIQRPMLPTSQQQQQQHNLTIPSRIRRATGQSRKQEHQQHHHHQEFARKIARRNSSRKMITAFPMTLDFVMMLNLLFIAMTAPIMSAHAFVIPPPTSSTTPSSPSSSSSSQRHYYRSQHHHHHHHQALQVMTDRFEADFVEQMVGGERYSMIPLPDSMTDTTLFVGNLCEFVSDDDLSRLFQTVSILHSVPACVARKPNTQSLEYGFVAFPTVEEKEAAIIRFNGFCYKGRSLRVQPIIDHPKQGRVRVPERLVAYVSGNKRGLRRYVARDKTGNNNNNSMNRPTCNGGSNTRNGSAWRSNSRGPTSSSSSSQSSKEHHHRQRRDSSKRTIKLSDQERAEMDRAIRKGFLTLTAGRRHYSIENKKGSSSLSYSLSPLAKKHRQWCDARGKPQIVLLKAVGGGAGSGAGGNLNNGSVSSSSNNVLDQVCIDLSPLRLPALFDDPHQAANVLQKWKAEIVLAASNAGMEFLESKTLSFLSLEDINDNISSPTDEHYSDSNSNKGNNNKKKKNWATDPIGKLPVLSLGTFLGERSKAKEMTKALAKLWDIPDQQQQQLQHEHEDNTGSRNTIHNNGGKERRLRYKNQRRRAATKPPISSSTAAVAAAAAAAGSIKGHKKPKITKGLSEHRKRGGGHRQSWY